MGDFNLASLPEADGPVVTITGMDGKEYEASLVACFTAGEPARDYCAVLSHEPNGAGEYPLMVFRYRETVRDGVEGMELINIGSDMEFEEAREALIALIGEGERSEGV